jgi:hypothetical protein
MISANIPEERFKEVFIYYYDLEIDQKTDNQIKRDLNRTLSELSPYNIEEAQNVLYRILRAFANNDTEVAYCQGMNFIAGFLLIMSDFNELETFYMMLALFSETFESNLAIRGFFSENFPMLKVYLYIFNHFFEKRMPELKAHFVKLEVPDEIWIAKWFQTLYSIALPVNILMRVWDCIMACGLEFIITLSLVLLKQLEGDLMKHNDSFDISDYFKEMGAFATGESSINQIDMESILKTAVKNRIPSSEINQIKKEYEKKFNIDLNSLKIQYDVCEKRLNIYSNSNNKLERKITNFEIHEQLIDNSSLNCENIIHLHNKNCNNNNNNDENNHNIVTRLGNKLAKETINGDKRLDKILFTIKEKEQLASKKSTSAENNTNLLFENNNSNNIDSSDLTKENLKINTFTNEDLTDVYDDTIEDEISSTNINSRITKHTLNVKSDMGLKFKKQDKT